LNLSERLKTEPFPSPPDYGSNESDKESERDNIC
jgi:hypothetical protein